MYGPPGRITRLSFRKVKRMALPLLSEALNGTGTLNGTPTMTVPVGSPLVAGANPPSIPSGYTPTPNPGIPNVPSSGTPMVNFPSLTTGAPADVAAANSTGWIVLLLVAVAAYFLFIKG
jgi:hypothetical protein